MADGDPAQGAGFIQFSGIPYIRGIKKDLRSAKVFFLVLVYFKTSSIK
jgi:hypothetical protein